MNERTRRTFLRAGLIAGASTFAGAMLLRAANEKKNEEEEEVSPVEDLMREHGVLKRDRSSTAKQSGASMPMRICRRSQLPTQRKSSAASLRTTMRSWRKIFFFPVSKRQANLWTWWTCSSSSIKADAA